MIMSLFGLWSLSRRCSLLRFLRCCFLLKPFEVASRPHLRCPTHLHTLNFFDKWATWISEKTVSRAAEAVMGTTALCAFLASNSNSLEIVLKMRNQSGFFNQNTILDQKNRNPKFGRPSISRTTQTTQTTQNEEEGEKEQKTDFLQIKWNFQGS